MFAALAPFAAPILGGLAGSALGGMFGGGGSDPMQEAQKRLGQIPGTIKPYMQPYIGAGKQALGSMQEQYGNLLQHPESLMNRLGSTYQSSPGYQWQLGEGTRAMNQAATAGGMAGSPQEQAELAKYSQGLANQDYMDYLNHLLGLYQTGLSGQQGLGQMGLGASTNLAQMLKDTLESQAGLGYSGEASKQMGQSNMMGGLAGLLKYLMPQGGAGGSPGAGASMLGGVGSSWI